jgi:hypothetical protein
MALLVSYEHTPYSTSAQPVADLKMVPHGCDFGLL